MKATLIALTKNEWRKPAGERIIILSMDDGSAFDPAKIYTVAINSYRAMGGGGMLERGAGISAADLLSLKFVTSATPRDQRQREDHPRGSRGRRKDEQLQPHVPAREVIRSEHCKGPLGVDAGRAFRFRD